MLPVILPPIPHICRSTSLVLKILPPIPHISRCNSASLVHKRTNFSFIFKPLVPSFSIFSTTSLLNKFRFFGTHKNNNTFKSTNYNDNNRFNNRASLNFNRSERDSTRKKTCLVLSLKWPNTSTEEALWDREEAHKLVESLNWLPIAHPMVRMVNGHANDRFCLGQGDIRRMIKRLCDLHEGRDNLENLMRLARESSLQDEFGNNKDKWIKMGIEENSISSTDISLDAGANSSEEIHFPGKGSNKNVKDIESEFLTLAEMEKKKKKFNKKLFTLPVKNQNDIHDQNSDIELETYEQLSTVLFIC